METSNRVVCGMVLGEASESDDDSDAPMEFPAATSFQAAVGSQSVSLKPKSPKSSKHKLKYNTLLHYRLRDSNIALRSDMVTAVELPVARANSRLTEALQLQAKTKQSLHELPRALHQLSVSLVGLQDRLPSMVNVKFIPEVKPAVAAAQIGQVE